METSTAIAFCALFLATLSSATGECIRIVVGEVASGVRFAATVLGRPPGHHAGPRLSLREGSNGFCFFNNAVLALSALSLEHALDERVAVHLTVDLRARLMTLLELATAKLADKARKWGHLFFPLVRTQCKQNDHLPDL